MLARCKRLQIRRREFNGDAADRRRVVRLIDDNAVHQDAREVADRLLVANRALEHETRRDTATLIPNEPIAFGSVIRDRLILRIVARNDRFLYRCVRRSRVVHGLTGYRAACKLEAIRTHNAGRWRGDLGDSREIRERRLVIGVVFCRIDDIRIGHEDCKAIRRREDQFIRGIIQFDVELRPHEAHRGAAIGRSGRHLDRGIDDLESLGQIDAEHLARRADFNQQLAAVLHFDGGILAAIGNDALGAMDGIGGDPDVHLCAFIHVQALEGLAANGAEPSRIVFVRILRIHRDIEFGSVQRNRVIAAYGVHMVDDLAIGQHHVRVGVRIDVDGRLVADHVSAHED